MVDTRNKESNCKSADSSIRRQSDLIPAEAVAIHLRNSLPEWKNGTRLTINSKAEFIPVVIDVIRSSSLGLGTEQE